MPKLTDIPNSKVYNAQQSALMRLQLWFVGETHRLLSNATKSMKAIIFEQGGEDGELDSASAFMAQTKMTNAWQDEFFDPWTTAFVRVREEAAMLPFGTLAVMHEEIREQVSGIRDQEAGISESSPLPLRDFPPAPLRPSGTSPRGGEELLESVDGGVFEPQLRAVMDAANTHIYSDGLQLSGRIWRMDREAREGINRVLMQGIVDKSSAWDVAKNLEQYLGAGAGCPRWTKSRLYGLTKTQIAQGSKTGLLTGTQCNGKGVSYNALRLARTEIQRIHHEANDAMMASVPWIKEEQIHLSPSHPKPDICDDVVGGGDNGDGVYPKGTISLPLHPNCLCYKTAVLIEDFAKKVKAWMRGESEWAEMDSYHQMVGGVESSLIASSVAVILEKWLFGEAGLDE